jgi:heat shock protein HslJ
MSADDLMDARLRAAGERWRQTTNETDAPIGDENVLDLTDPVVHRPRRRWALVAAAAAVIVVGGGVAGIVASGGDSHPVAGPEATSQLVDRTWVLTAVRNAKGKAIDTSPVAATATLLIANGRISGSDGCNGFGGYAKVAGNRIVLDGVAGNLIGCTPGVRAVAAIVHKVLTGTVDWQVNDSDVLTVGNAHGTLGYKPGPAQSVAGLTDRTWTLIGAHDAAGNPVPLASAVATLRFAKGQVVGRDGCNALSGKAKVVARTIEFGPLVSTEIGCTGDLSNVAATVDKVLGATVDWQIDNGNELTIGNNYGTLDLLARSETTVTTSQLVGQWTVTGVQHEDGDSSSGEGASDLADRVTFGADGSLVVVHRCYTNIGRYTVDGKSVSISGITLGKAIPCAALPNQADLQRLDGYVDDVLSGQATWAISDGMLNVKKGSTTVQFERADAPGSNASSTHS